MGSKCSVLPAAYAGYLDFDQGQITAVLLTLVGGLDALKAKFPTYFNGKSCTIQDSRKDYYEITLTITKISEDSFQVERFGNRFEHLIVTDLGNGAHCLFVDRYQNDEILCINSWGPDNDPTPLIKLSANPDLNPDYYQVSAQAVQLNSHAQNLTSAGWSCFC